MVMAACDVTVGVSEKHAPKILTLTIIESHNKAFLLDETKNEIPPVITHHYPKYNDIIHTTQTC